MKHIQIIEDYKNKKLIKDIIVKHNISYYSLIKLLKKYNVYEKYSTLTYSEEIIEYIKANYGKIPNKTIANYLKISEDHLITKVKILGLNLVGSGFKFKKDLSKINENSQEFKYYLGWMASDGNISLNFRNVSLSITDSEIIYKFKEIFPEAKIYINKTANKPMYQLMICSVQFAKKLFSYGITPNKSKTLAIHKSIFDSNFVRGFFEGDGHVRKPSIFLNKKRFEAGFVCASKDFTNTLVEYLLENNIKSVVYLENNSYYRIRISGKENLFIFYKFIYQNCNQWYLSRKKQILDHLFSDKQNEYCELLENQEIDNQQPNITEM